MFATPTADRDRRRRRATVHAGDVLGYVGAPMPGSFKRLHFALWIRDEHDDFEPIDPRAELSRWMVLPWTRDHITMTDEPQLAA